MRQRMGGRGGRGRVRGARASWARGRGHGVATAVPGGGGGLAASKHGLGPTWGPQCAGVSAHEGATACRGRGPGCASVLRP